MKSLLFIGATLMVGAGIYGFVDYKKKNQSKEFKALYKEEKPVVLQSAPEVVTFPVSTVATATEEKLPVVESKSYAASKAGKRKHKFTAKTFSRAIPEDEVKIEEVPLLKEIAPVVPTKKGL